jgi:peptide deformylase
MKFEVIPNEQTPKVPEIEDVKSFILENLEKLLAFKDYAYSLSGSAVGLAANQTSLDGERFMFKVFAIKNEVFLTGWSLVINPQIVEYLGVVDTKLEGCLTWKNRGILAERNRAIKVTYTNEFGVLFENQIIKGFTAQIWQHEVNHLNGIPENIVDANYPEPKKIVINRNDDCPCGSGKKYKRCCIIYS